MFHIYYSLSAPFCAHLQRSIPCNSTPSFLTYQWSPQLHSALLSSLIMPTCFFLLHLCSLSCLYFYITSNLHYSHIQSTRNPPNINFSTDFCIIQNLIKHPNYQYIDNIMLCNDYIHSCYPPLPAIRLISTQRQRNKRKHGTVHYKSLISTGVLFVRSYFLPSPLLVSDLTIHLFTFQKTPTSLVLTSTAHILSKQKSIHPNPLQLSHFVFGMHSIRV